MGVAASWMWSWLFPRKEYKIVVVGLDNAGKTTMLYKLYLGEVVITRPTVGSNVEEVKYRNLTFEMWDLGGQQALRPSWETYYQDTDAVVLVVDSTDRGRLGTVKEELFQLLAHENLRRASVLVLANKQDLADAMTAAELSTSLCLTDIKKHSWHIQASCALTGEGLWEGMEWISEEVKQKHKAKEKGEKIANPVNSPVT